MIYFAVFVLDSVLLFLSAVLSVAFKFLINVSKSSSSVSSNADLVASEGEGASPVFQASFVTAATSGIAIGISVGSVLFLERGVESFSVFSGSSVPLEQTLILHVANWPLAIWANM